MFRISIIGQLAELPILIGVIGEVSAYDEWDLPLGKFSFSEFVWISLVGLRMDHWWRILGQLKCSGTEDSSTLILGQESGGYPFFCSDGTPLVSEAISADLLHIFLFTTHLFFGLDDADIFVVAALVAFLIRHFVLYISVLN